MAKRSKELVQVGYYLSRYGKSEPPTRFNTNKWNEVYRMFYDSLNGGRTVEEFENSLRNSRDDFDGYFPKTKRKGWKADDGSPTKLSGFAAVVFNEFENKNEESVWKVISKYTDASYKISSVIFNDLIAEDTASSDSDKTRTEGEVRVRISKTIERNAKLRQKALEIHGYSCQVCGFNFEKYYGRWGKTFAEVHHVKPLAELRGKKMITDPKSDLVVLCANCHKMIHRKKGITLSVDELKAKLQK
jgi:hypothetical protein